MRAILQERPSEQLLPAHLKDFDIQAKVPENGCAAIPNLLAEPTRPPVLAKRASCPEGSRDRKRLPFTILRVSSREHCLCSSQATYGGYQLETSPGALICSVFKGPRSRDQQFLVQGRSRMLVYQIEAARLKCFSHAASDTRPPRSRARALPPHQPQPPSHPPNISGTTSSSPPKPSPPPDSMRSNRTCKGSAERSGPVTCRLGPPFRPK